MLKLVGEREAARILGLGVQTLRNWRCARRGPCYVKLGRAVRYKVEDLERYLEAKRIDPEERLLVKKRGSRQGLA